MLLDVPFLPDTGYTTFLQEHEQSLYSVHFSLLQEDIPDCRHNTAILDLRDVSRSLSCLGRVKKYALLNSRFYAADAYLDREKISRILEVLEYLLGEGNIDGVVVVDLYLVHALSDASPEITSQLEAVPGVNCMLDSFGRIRCWLDCLSRTNFALPAKLNLDRSLNRTIGALREVSAGCRQEYPDIALSLLANEGCLFRCPFKLTHDAHIAQARTRPCGDRTYEMNRSLGCIRILSDRPEEILRSPFIRPEDRRHYAQYADMLKICGRTLGASFLRDTVSAYLGEKYEGNLLALLDTQDWQVDRLELVNEDFPHDYFEQLTGCGLDCAACDYCRRLFARISRFRPLALKDFRTPRS